jgi:hypothetical protein
VGEHRLAGAVEKFNRSKEQFDELRAEMEMFFNSEPKPHSSIGEFDTGAWEWVERFQIRRAPPLRFGVIFGDCLHNLRSCLDHVIWQVTLLDGGTPDDQTQYPIASHSEAQFNRMAGRRIPGLTAKHRAMVKKTQPYHRVDKASAHPLAMLAALSNADKHQVVHAAYNIANYDASATLDRLLESAQHEGPSPVEGWWLATRGSRLEHGTPWFRIVWRREEKPPREVKVTGNLTSEIAFGDIGMPASEFSKIAERSARSCRPSWRTSPRRNGSIEGGAGEPACHAALETTYRDDISVMRVT